MVTVNPASYLADLDTDLTLPKSPTVASNFPRGSVASFATFMTDCSADAIIPLSSQSRSRRSFSADSRQSGAVSDIEGPWSDDEDLLDTYFNGVQRISSLLRKCANNNISKTHSLVPRRWPLRADLRHL